MADQGLQDTKIYLETYYDEELKSSLVSHGIGNITFKNYTLPTEPITAFSPRRDEVGLYI